MTDLRVVRVMVVKMGIIVRETIMEILEIEDMVEAILGAIQEATVEEEVDLARALILEGQEWPVKL